MFQAKETGTDTVYGNFLNTDLATLYDLQLDSDFAAGCSIGGNVAVTCGQSATYNQTVTYANVIVYTIHDETI